MGVPAQKIANFELRASSLNATTLAESSDRQSCDYNSRYRTIDGTCNSYYQPGFGKSNSIFQRLVYWWNSYSDSNLFITFIQANAINV